MSIIRELQRVKDIYKEAEQHGWVLPCFCSENLTTTEAIMTACAEFGKDHGITRVPIIIAITCNYSHRTQAANYTTTRRWDTGLKLFTGDIKALAEDSGPFEDLDVMLHLDHIQHDSDFELLNGSLHDYASIMYDASSLTFDENIKKTAAFVSKCSKEILIEGACDEIMDATGSEHNDLTTPEDAKRYASQTGVDLVVANLGTEHRASGKELKYHGEIARQIKAQIGSKIVLHGTSSVSNEQVVSLFKDGIRKVNIWTALERDSTPALLDAMVRNAAKVGGQECINKLINDGFLTDKVQTGEKAALFYYTTMYRQDIVFAEMKKIVRAYLDMWYI